MGLTFCSFRQNRLSGGVFELLDVRIPPENPAPPLYRTGSMRRWFDGALGFPPELGRRAMIGGAKKVSEAPHF